MNRYRSSKLFSIVFAITLAVGCLALISVSANAQERDDKKYQKRNDPKLNRHRGLYLLDQIKQILKAYYYDKNFRGMDVEKRFKQAEEQIKSHEYNWQIFRSIAQVLAELNDSHTIFYPPERAYRVEYGFSTMIIGNKCFVTTVKRGSDAEKKGVKAGDEVISVGEITPTRDNYSTVNYIIYGLDPQEKLKLGLIGSDGRKRELEVVSKFLSPEERKKEQKELKDDEASKPFTCKELSDIVIACKLRTFDTSKEQVAKMMKTVAPYQKLLLDLRGNGGGRADTHNYLVGRFFESDVIIGTEERRGKKKQEVAKGSRDAAYKGELAVLIDSESWSAAEVFARVIQLQKRGKIFGDTSAGGVVGAYLFGIPVPLYEAASMASMTAYRNDYYVSFFSITVADLIMSDGGRLEGIGVVPDVRIGPSPLALSEGNDPIFAHVAATLGITPKQAGELYFLIPRTESQIDDANGELQDGR